MLSERLASVGMLAAGVAHEINNPLTYVVGNVSLARDELEAVIRDAGGAADGEGAAADGAPGSADRLVALRDALRDAEAGAARVRAIVRDMRTLSRREDGPSSQVDVREVLECAAGVAWHAIRHRARLCKDLGATPAVLGSESRLGQVCLNLLVNAAHAIPAGAASTNEVRVATRTDPGGQAVIEVSDTGVGIPAEHLGRVFDPFFTTKPTGVGTGLGLSICHTIVEEMGGRIEVESRLGQGTTFRVLLPPAELPRVQEACAHAPRPLPNGRRRILVVDDDPLVRSTVERILSPLHEVHAVGDGREALRRVADGELFDVVVSDLMMPEMTGMELYRRLRDVAPHLSRRVLFVTGAASTPEVHDFLESVSHPRLEKPFTPEVLRHAVMSLGA